MAGSGDGVGPDRGAAAGEDSELEGLVRLVADLLRV